MRRCLFDQSENEGEELPFHNLAVVSRTHVLIGRIVDGLVQEVNAAVGESELGTRGMLRTEAPREIGRAHV